MITLKRYSIKIPENDENLFMRLYWDTTKVDDLVGEEWADMMRSLKKRFDTMWVGIVDRNTREFALRRTTGGYFVRAQSIFMIEGRLKRQGVGKTVEVEVGVSWFAALQLLILIGFFIPLGITVNDAFFWGVIALVNVVQCKLIYDDFTNSAELICAYLKNPEKISKFVIK